MSHAIALHWAGVGHFLVALVAAPLLLGIINRTKAVIAGRRGAPLFQPYYELARLLRKGAVYSRTTSWVFRAGPVVGLAAALCALPLVPLGGAPSVVAFSGDALVVVYLLALMRFFTVLAALDTGSSFEGMGSSREVLFSALAEPALALGLATLAVRAGRLSLGPMYAAIDPAAFLQAGPALMLVASAMVAVYLTENARIPIDDPNTHLELTMIHEVMVLDHSGPDLAMIEYAAALKLWILGALVVGLLPLRTGVWWGDLAVGAALMGLLAVATGLIESSMARLRLARVPQFLVAASVLSVLALALVMR